MDNGENKTDLTTSQQAPPAPEKITPEKFAPEKTETSMTPEHWMTERKNLLERIAQLEEQLARVGQLTAVGELASTTTHEFNNILMTIINYAKLAMRHTDEATRVKSLDKILSSANRAAKITSTVLGMARNRKPGLEPTNITTLVEDVLLLLEREMNKYRIAVEKNFNPVPEIMANGNQVQQVLVNLLINARQAMSAGGRLVLRLNYDEAARMVDLVVRDYGCGIEPEKLRRIFDSFYTSKSGPDESGKGGTGLGLSLCRNIMEAHHGKIRVESTVGKGTAFTLRFPVADDSPIETAVQTTAQQPTAQSTVQPGAASPHEK